MADGRLYVGVYPEFNCREKPYARAARHPLLQFRIPCQSAVHRRLKPDPVEARPVERKNLLPLGTLAAYYGRS